MARSGWIVTPEMVKAKAGGMSPTEVLEHLKELQAWLKDFPGNDFTNMLPALEAAIAILQPILERCND